MLRLRILAARPAEVVLLDLRGEFPLEAARFASLSRNCPFDGERVRGRVAGLLLRDRLLPGTGGQ